MNEQYSRNFVWISTCRLLIHVSHCIVDHVCIRSIIAKALGIQFLIVTRWSEVRARNGTAKTHGHPTLHYDSWFSGETWWLLRHRSVERIEQTNRLTAHQRQESNYFSFRWMIKLKETCSMMFREQIFHVRHLCETPWHYANNLNVRQSACYNRNTKSARYAHDRNENGM